MTEARFAFHNVSAVYRAADRAKVVLQDASVTAPDGRYAVVCDDDAARIAFMDLLSGKRQPRKGGIRFRGERSFPIGRLGLFSTPLTGYAFLKHLATFYDVSHSETRTLFEHLLQEDSVLLSQKMITWPAAMRVKFSLAAGLIRPFDIYVFDGALQQNQFPDFTKRWAPLFAERCRSATLIASSRQVRVLELLVDRVLLVSGGKLALADLSHLKDQPVEEAAPSAPEEQEVPIDADFI